jgi:hypothetical protein
MTDDIRVFVNAAPVTVPPGATVLDAVRAWKPDEAQGVTGGSRLVTDSRGLPIEPGVVLQAGAILRTVTRRDGASVDDEPAPESA